MRASSSRDLLNTACGSGVAFFHNGDRAEMRAAILELKDELMAGEGVEFPVSHQIAHGTYTRTLFIPKGSLLVGKTHLKDCMNVVARGDISLLTEFGAKRVQGGFTGISQAGIMKVGYAHEDTVFMNVFLTDAINLDQIELEIASESIDTLIEFEPKEAVL